MRSVRAVFLKFSGTNDKGWLWFRLCTCGALGVVFVLFCESSYVFGVVDSLVLYSFIWSSKKNLFFVLEKISKNPAKRVPATHTRLFTCVFCACIVDTF